MESSKFQLGICCGVAAKFQEKQRLLTSWLNRDQGTCHTENLKQAPFGGSRGHLFCVEERKACAKYSFQSYPADTEHHLLFHVGYGSITTEKQKK